MHGVSAAFRESRRREDLDDPEAPCKFQTFAQRDLLSVIHAATLVELRTRFESKLDPSPHFATSTNA